MSNEFAFIATKEYKKFGEFCDSCKDYRYIGLCYGAPGIGKTLSALKYSNWQKIRNFYDSNLMQFFKQPNSLSLPSEVPECDTIFEVASSTNTPSRTEKAIMSSAYTLKFMKYFYVHKQYSRDPLLSDFERFSEVKLLIIDEVDLLKYTTLEQLRIMYDKFGYGMVLIGMPGIERRLSRYPQLYSRVGFVHEFKALSKDEITFIIEHHLEQLGSKISMDVLSDYETLHAIIRMTKGNFRVMIRLFQQLERLMKINNLSSVNLDLVNTAREILVISS